MSPPIGLCPLLWNERLGATIGLGQGLCSWHFVCVCMCTPVCVSVLGGGGFILEGAALAGKPLSSVSANIE